ncbi:DUF1998 domain-containing protein [Leptospira interrogans]|uniref:DUF1998 domain-containing protein n=1 Tax=Leptospira interrogans TaxID=173 RepID=UPI000774B873|nr:DUF1998 domain-containing protein [Leptospira interrogans]
MNKQVIGNVRPSQLITAFGPGAIVDLHTLSIVVAGIDLWPKEQDLVIHETRLEKALDVKRFYSARPVESIFGAHGTIPAFIFPRYQLCPRCRTLSKLNEEYLRYDSKRKEIKCTHPDCGKDKDGNVISNIPKTTLPAPFIVACPAGHLDEFPWRRYVHRSESDCSARMRLFSRSEHGTVADLHVRCDCGRQRSMSDAFGKNKLEATGLCKGAQPWFGISENEGHKCSRNAELKTILRGASNAWFPVIQSALKIDLESTPLGIALSKIPIDTMDEIRTEEKITALLTLFPQLNEFSAKEILDYLQKKNGVLSPDDLDLRYPEWCALRRNPEETLPEDEFLLEGSSAGLFQKFISNVVIVRKLIEVRALVGFTRIDPISNFNLDFFEDVISPISQRKLDWLPAVEIKGEGIFIELNEDALSEWESRSVVRERTNDIYRIFIEMSFTENQKTERLNRKLFPREVLLHTFSHLLIRQLALDCGYSSSSIRERIYCSSDPKKRMAGVLIYTGSADSDGSLGGLADIGNSERFQKLVRDALKSALICSSDPLCANHTPDLQSSLNGATCHACSLVSETSCENFNLFLDRNFIVETLARQGMAYFDTKSYQELS